MTCRLGGGGLAPFVNGTDGEWEREGRDVGPTGVIRWAPDDSVVTCSGGLGTYFLLD